MSKTNTQPVFATLHVPHVFTTKEPWLGWNVVFDPSVSEEQIAHSKTHAELALNDYLEQNVDVVANNLVVPFTNVLTPTKDPRFYTFKIKVFVKNKGDKKVRFPYPPEPVTRIDGFVLKLNKLHGGSHTNTITIKPPPH